MKPSILLLLLGISAHSFCQLNLIRNGSFEMPYNEDSLSRSVNFFWSFLEDYNPREMGWAHFYRRNSDIYYEVPENGAGYQFPQDGVSYAGFGTFDEDFEFREYLVGTLATHLEKDKKYKLSFYINLANCSKYAINSFGAAFVNESSLGKLAKRHYLAIDELTPNFEYSGEVIRDTVNWKLMEGEITVQGGEDRVIIGCFQPDTKISVKKLDCKGCKKKDESLKRTAYYLIDNIRLEMKKD